MRIAQRFGVRNAAQRFGVRKAAQRAAQRAGALAAGRPEAQGRAEWPLALVSAVVALAACGAIAVFSATAPFDLSRAVPPHFTRQLLALPLGAAVAWAVSRLPLPLWRRAALPLWGVGVAALAFTLLFGVSAGGARRWLSLGGLGFQPAEAARLTTLLAIAWLLSRPQTGRSGLSGRQVLQALGLAVLPAALCVLQPDFGGAVILCLLAGVLVFVAGASLRHLAAPLAVGIAGLVAYSAMQPYAARRWVGFLDPWARATTEGFQLVQSFVAFGRGGWAGVGLGNGRQKLFYLPEAHNDFILSVIAEETGLLGVLVVLGAFALLSAAGLGIAQGARDRFARLAATGATGLLAIPGALNAAVAMGCLPTKGLPLPFVSYGRSSLLICCAAVGLLLAVARDSRAGGRRWRGAL